MFFEKGVAPKRIYRLLTWEVGYWVGEELESRGPTFPILFITI